jgi:hypothetical protein
MSEEMIYQLIALAFVSGSFVKTVKASLRCLKEGAAEQKAHMDRIEAKIDALPCCQPQWKNCHEIQR